LSTRDVLDCTQILYGILRYPGVFQKQTQREEQMHELSKNTSAQTETSMYWLL